MTPARRRGSFLIVAGPLLLVLLLRLATMVFLFPGGRHGYTAEQISAAIGVMEGRGLSTTWSEIRYVKEHPSNLTLNVDDVYFPRLRTRFDALLPLPSYVMTMVWSVCGTRSMLAYLLFMLLAEIAALAPLFSIMRARFGGRPVWILALLLGANVALGRIVVSISYDPYAYLGSLLAFTAGVLLLERRNAGGMLLASALSAITIFGRELNLLLYPVVGGFAALVAMRSRSGDLFRRAVLFLVPFVAVVGFTVYYRYVTTGNPRPTRTVFWHSLWVGVGQFSNPYGLTLDDGSVIAFGRKLDPTLRQNEEDYSERYEQVLAARARTLFREHPWLLIRNASYRTAMILSPGLYSDGDTIPVRYGGIAAVLSVIGTGLMVFGALKVRRIAPSFFWMILITVSAEILSFSWFYIVGRVILLSSHVYLIPLAVLFAGKAARPEESPATTASAQGRY